MEAREEKLGSRHPDTLTSMANLSVISWHLPGQLNKADALLSQAIKLMEEIMGFQHPTTSQFRKQLHQLKSLRG